MPVLECITWAVPVRWALSFGLDLLTCVFAGAATYFVLGGPPRGSR